jgi:hypothetical protein
MESSRNRLSSERKEAMVEKGWTVAGGRWTVVKAEKEKTRNEETRNRGRRADGIKKELNSVFLLLSPPSTIQSRVHPRPDLPPSAEGREFRGFFVVVDSTVH